MYHCCFHFTHGETEAQRGKENFPKATGVGSQHLILNPSLIAEPTLFQLLCHTTSCTYMFCLPSYATQLQSIITAPGPAAGSMHRRGELSRTTEETSRMSQCSQACRSLRGILRVPAVYTSPAPCYTLHHRILTTIDWPRFPEKDTEAQRG